ncbi:MAG TPA: phosphodiester glycosidase family protein, partial [Luteolibacter sp.]
SWNTASSLGSGVWYENRSGNVAITRREKIGRAGAPSMRELIQAGPLLVENGRAVNGLEATKVSARTVIWSDGGSGWWIGRSSPCTLAALARALAEWPARHALNLDGGRSSELWISEKLAGSPVFRRPPWNRPVRNFLVLVAK